MDAALLAEREAFKRRAMAVPTIENKKRPKVRLKCEQILYLMRCKEFIILAQEKYFKKYSVQIGALDSRQR